MKRTVIMLALVAAVAAVVAAGAMPAQAAASESKFKIFANAAYVSPLSDSNQDIDGIQESVEASDEVGWEVGGEWKPWPRFGFELTYLDVTNDIEADGTKIGEIGINPLFLTLNFHIVNGDRFSWYAGPTVSYIDWGSFEPSDGSGDQSIDSETTFGISTGLEFGLGEHFSILGGLRWIDSSAELADGSADIAVDPLFARLGVAWRF